MNYHKTITLKDGRTCVIRNGTAEDGKTLLDIFALTHAQTDFLLTYPEESTHTPQQEAEYMKQKAESADEIEILAENKAALALYKSVGFVEYGRNPKGFRSRTTGWQELVLMRLELNKLAC